MEELKEAYFRLAALEAVHSYFFYLFYAAQGFSCPVTAYESPRLNNSLYSKSLPDTRGPIAAPEWQRNQLRARVPGLQCLWLGCQPTKHRNVEDDALMRVSYGLDPCRDMVNSRCSGC